MLHIKKIKPLFTSIVTTGDKFEKDFKENGIIVAKKGDLKLWQRVIAVGDCVRNIKVGDMVMIDASHYEVKRYSQDSLQNDIDNNPVLKYQFNWVTLEEIPNEPKDCLLLNDRDILYVFEGEEKEDIIHIPNSKKFIVN